jgi:hypothetical protein
MTGRSQVDDPVVRLESAINAYARVVAANRTAVLLTYRETKMLKPDYIEQMKQHELETNGFIEACLDDCIAAGYLKETHVELLAYRIITAAHVWALKHWRLAKIVSFDEYLEGAIHACWKPLLSAKGSRHVEKLKRDEQLRQATQAL